MKILPLASVFISFVFVYNSVYGESLTEISKFAKEICDEIRLEGTVSRTEVEAKINGKMDGVAKLLGLSAGADGKFSKNGVVYKGLPFEELGEQMSDARECRRKLGETLTKGEQRISGTSTQNGNLCSAREGYPLGKWEVGTKNATDATYATFVMFTTSTSGTWIPFSGEGSFKTSAAPTPGEPVVITSIVEGTTYKSVNKLVVSADGCRMTGTFLDSEDHTGEAWYEWKGVN